MWATRQSAIGRIAVPPFVPRGFAVFCTTIDFDGKLTGGGADLLTRVAQENFGVQTSLTTCRQVHGTTVEHATDDQSWRECDCCDALWSDQEQVALGIKIADCLPISILDPVHGVIANIHSGWRGTVQQITRVTIETLRARTPFHPHGSYAYLGPSIRACCFEVGEEVVDQFTASYGDVTAHTDRTRGKPRLNVAGLTIDVLRRAGFRDERIDDSGLCTRCDGSIFHSFRRDGGRGGRNLAVAARGDRRPQAGAAQSSSP
jgi:YfiH family protein